MTHRLRPWILSACALACAPTASGEIALSDVFGDHMILQRELPVPVWGQASAGQKVTVTFAGQTLTTNADGQGAWRVTLKPLATSATGRTLTVSGSNTVTFSDVLVGEVWLCSGQSNMAERFVRSKGRSIEPKAFEQDLTRFRFTTRLGWKALTPRSQPFLSRVAYYFGIELYRQLKVPVGLILRYHSGTPIQAWMPPEAAEVIRKRLNIPRDWNDDATNRRPGFQFREKIAPIVPVAFRGVIWYQGERNAKTRTGWEYRHLLPFLIQTWRQRWGRDAGLTPRKFPFYYVQVPTQDGAPDAEWPWLRDAMRRALKTTENTGMAVFYDHGPSLHPPNKQPAGKRLSLWALARDYGRKDLVHCGPLLDEVRIQGARAILTFTHVGGGLRNASPGKRLKFFELAGKDGKYVPANARIEGDTVVVDSQALPRPVYVRYLFRKPKPDPEVSLVNAEGLPASSFMTDDFKPPRAGQPGRDKQPVLRPTVVTFPPEVQAACKDLNQQALLYQPTERPGGKIPLVVLLHGAGGTRKKDIASFKVNRDVVWLVGPRNRKHSAKVLVPQSAGLWDPNSLNRMLDHILKTNQDIDTDRVYCIGYSMGGKGTWDWAMSSPDRLAAIVPVAFIPNLGKLKDMVDLPIWAMVGTRDRRRARAVPGMVKALRELGSTAIRTTVFEGANHFATAAKAWAVEGLLDWLFAQSLKKRPVRPADGSSRRARDVPMV